MPPFGGGTVFPWGCELNSKAEEYDSGETEFSLRVNPNSAGLWEFLYAGPILRLLVENYQARYGDGRKVLIYESDCYIKNLNKNSTKVQYLNTPTCSFVLNPVMLLHFPNKVTFLQASIHQYLGV